MRQPFHSRLLFLFLFLFLNLRSSAQTIPINRLIDWSVAGYPDSFPQPSLVLDVMDFGASGNGITDDAQAIRDAIDSLHGNQGVVYFPPGQYLIGSMIDLPDSVVLRGATSDSTHIIFNFNGNVGNGFNIGGSESGVFTNITSGAFRGSNQVIVDDSTLFTTGDYAEVMQDNGTWDTQPAVWATNCIGQIVRIIYVNGDTIFFDTPLRYDYDTLLNVRMQRITPAREVGIECMQISRADTVASGVCYNVNYLFAANCWMKGVESSRSIGSHVEIDASTNITITGCYFHHSQDYDGASTHGYGITLFDHSGQCLIQNNIMEHLRHAFSLQTGANGNVIAYNYSRDPFRTEFPSDLGADISLHGHYPFSNLFEGNIVQNIMIDQAWGPSGPFNTFFRNRAELYGIIMTSGAVNSDSMTFVGNEVTSTAPFQGQYALAGTGHFEFGNNLQGTLSPPGTSPLPDSTVYLLGRPSYWNVTTFPSIGIPNTISTGSNPARDRYFGGGAKTACSDEIITGVSEFNDFTFELFPNPATTVVRVRMSPTNERTVIRIMDLFRRVVLETYSDAHVNEVTINLEGKLETGLYFIAIDFNSHQLVKPIFRINR